MNISGRKTLVTGATGGLGRAMAAELRRKGADLILTGRKADVLERLGNELGAQTAVVDLADRAAVTELIERAANVEILVANAALPASGPIDDFSPDEVDRALDVNLRVPILMARELSIQMRKRGEGQIIFISSVSGKTATVGSSLYSATKYGLRGFAQAMRSDLHGTGVGVSSIMPGFVRDAGMFADANVELPRYVGTCTPPQVAAAVVKAVEHNRGEITVAPVSVRVGTALAGLAPAALAAINRRIGAHEIATEVSAAQREKR